MISKKTTTFSIDGKNYRFDFDAFNSAFRLYARKKGFTLGFLEETLAASCSCSPDAVHNWRFRSNGPGDIEMVTRLTSALGIDKPHYFLKEIIERKEEPKMAKIKLEERQLDAAKRIYSAITKFLHEFYRSDGFNDYWFKYTNWGDPEEGIYQAVEKMHDHLFLVLEQEYFDLHNTGIYEAFSEFLHNDLYETYDGKLSYAYRFEAIPDGNPTVSDDYNKALDSLNLILETYI